MPGRLSEYIPGVKDEKYVPVEVTWEDCTMTAWEYIDGIQVKPERNAVDQVWLRVRRSQVICEKIFRSQKSRKSSIFQLFEEVF